MAVVCSMTGLYPGKFIFKKTILPISAGQAVCPPPQQKLYFYEGFYMTGCKYKIGNRLQKLLPINNRYSR